MAYGSYLNEDNPYADPYSYQDPYQQTGAIPEPMAPQTAPYFGAGLGPAAPPGAVPFTGQSAGNQATAAAAGTPNNLPVNQPGAGSAGPKDFLGIVQWWKSAHPASAPDIPGLMAYLNAQGIPATNAVHNGMQSDDKLIVNGQMYDFGSSFGGPGAQWFDAPSVVGGDGGGAFAIDPSYLAPYTRSFQAPGDAALPQFQSPGAFKMPSLADVMADPGYKFREGRIRDSIQNSASAAGILNTTGTLDRIEGSIGDFAGQEYGNVFNRNYNLWNSDWQHALSDYGARAGRSNDVYNRALGEFGLDKDIFQQNQDRPYNKIFQGIDLGSRVAGA